MMRRKGASSAKCPFVSGTWSLVHKIYMKLYVEKNPPVDSLEPSRSHDPRRRSANLTQYQVQEQQRSFTGGDTGSPGSRLPWRASRGKHLTLCCPAWQEMRARPSPHTGAPRLTR